MEKFVHDRCGVTAAKVWEEDSLFYYLYEGLCAVQHRGQESSGISFTGREFKTIKVKGLASQLTNYGSEVMGFAGIGHNRYSTRGGTNGEEFMQPVELTEGNERLALAFNGDVANFEELRMSIRNETSTVVRTDSGLLLHLIASGVAKGDIFGAYEVISSLVKGSYSAVVLYEEGNNSNVLAFRDPYGFKPLCVGFNDDGFFVNSESVAFSPCYVGAELMKEVNPGEVAIISSSGVQSKQVVKSSRHAHCMFEYVYFARPDSLFEGRSIYVVREELGKALGERFPVNADIVVPVPDSGRSAAAGLSESTGVPMKEGFQKDRYLYRRSFIMDKHRDRQNAVRKKLNPIESVVSGKRVVVVDDSIVRGASVRRYVSDLKKAGAKEIHIRISCPPLVDRCPYGIDFYREELIARKYLGSSHDEICEKVGQELGADSIRYNTVEDLVSSIGLGENELCLGCLTRAYVHEDIPIEGKMLKKC